MYHILTKRLHFSWAFCWYPQFFSWVFIEPIFCGVSGFADLEFAMAASHHSAITEDTLVVTTVHDCQVFDNLPEDIFQSHDLSVDVIVTPTEVFRFVATAVHCKFANLHNK